MQAFYQAELQPDLVLTSRQRCRVGVAVRWRGAHSGAAPFECNEIFAMHHTKKTRRAFGLPVSATTMTGLAKIKRDGGAEPPDPGQGGRATHATAQEQRER